MWLRVSVCVAIIGLLLCVEAADTLAGPMARRFGGTRWRTPNAVEADRDDPVSAAVALGDKLREEEKWEEAAAAYSRAIELDPNCAKAFCGRGRVLGNKGNLEASMADLNQAIKLDPSDARAFNARGCNHCERADFDKAIVDIDEALRLDPDLSSGYINRCGCHYMRGEFDEALTDIDRAIQLNPTKDSYLWQRSKINAARREWPAAAEDLSEAIRLRPEFPTYYEWRAEAWIHCNEYDRAMADFRTVFELNGKDPAARFEDWHKKTLSPNDLQHGQRQVDRMLKGRPAMAQYGNNALPLAQWAVRKFAGEDLGRRIRWENDDPKRSWCAETEVLAEGEQSSGSAERRCIRVRKTYRDGSQKGKDRPFEELWANAVFELYNSASDKDFDRVVAEATAGKLSRREYARKIMEVEGIAAEKTRAFYIHVFLPWAKEHNVSTHPGLWYVALQTKPDDNRFLAIMDKDDPHWAYYESDYDKMVLTSLAESGQYEKAEARALEMERRAATQQDKTTIYSFLGQLHAYRGNHAMAVDYLSKALRVTPNDVNLLRSRGWLYQRRGEFEKAIADFSEAIRLAPNDIVSRNCRGYTFSAQGQQDKAIAEYNEALRIDPKCSDTFCARGVAFERKADYDKALSDYSQAVRLNPKNAMALYDRGGIRQIKGNLDGALADYNDAIRLDRSIVDAYRNRANIYAQRKETAKALASCGEGIRNNPKSANLYVCRARIRADSGEFQEAIADTKDALDIEPGNQEATQLRDQLKRRVAELVKGNTSTGSTLQPTTFPSYFGDAFGDSARRAKGTSDRRK